MKVDLYSLDVEGGEMSVLKTLDFNLISIHYLMMEAQDSAALNKDIGDFMQSKGFKQVDSFSGDILYKNSKWTE